MICGFLAVRLGVTSANLGVAKSKSVVVLLILEPIKRCVWVSGLRSRRQWLDQTSGIGTKRPGSRSAAEQPLCMQNNLLLLLSCWCLPWWLPPFSFQVTKPPLPPSSVAFAKLASYGWMTSWPLFSKYSTGEASGCVLKRASLNTERHSPCESEGGPIASMYIGKPLDGLPHCLLSFGRLPL